MNSIKGIISLKQRVNLFKSSDPIELNSTIERLYDWLGQQKVGLHDGFKQQCSSAGAIPRTRLRMLGQPPRSTSLLQAGRHAAAVSAVRRQWWLTSLRRGISMEVIMEPLSPSPPASIRKYTNKKVTGSGHCRLSPRGYARAPQSYPAPAACSHNRVREHRAPGAHAISSLFFQPARAVSEHSRTRACAENTPAPAARAFGRYHGFVSRPLGIRARRRAPTTSTRVHQGLARACTKHALRDAR
jgi:hypothetical protein